MMPYRFGFNQRKLAPPHLGVIAQSRGDNVKPVAKAFKVLSFGSPNKSSKMRSTLGCFWEFFIFVVKQFLKVQTCFRSN